VLSADELHRSVVRYSFYWKKREKKI